MHGIYITACDLKKMQIFYIEYWGEIQLWNSKWTNRTRCISLVCGFWSGIELREHGSQWRGTWWRRDLPCLTVSPLPTSGHPFLSGSCPGGSNKRRFSWKRALVGLSFSIKLNPNILSRPWKEQVLISGEFIVQITDIITLQPHILHNHILKPVVMFSYHNIANRYSCCWASFSVWPGQVRTSGEKRKKWKQHLAGWMLGN